MLMDKIIIEVDEQMKKDFRQKCFEERKTQREIITFWIEQWLLKGKS